MATLQVIQGQELIFSNFCREKKPVFKNAFLKKNHRFKDFEDLSVGKFHPKRFVQGHT